MSSYIRSYCNGCIVGSKQCPAYDLDSGRFGNMFPAGKVRNDITIKFEIDGKPFKIDGTGVFPNSAAGRSCNLRY